MGKKVKEQVRYSENFGAGVLNRGVLDHYHKALVSPTPRRRSDQNWWLSMHTS